MSSNITSIECNLITYCSSKGVSLKMQIYSNKIVLLKILLLLNTCCTRYSVFSIRFIEITLHLIIKSIDKNTYRLMVFRNKNSHSHPEGAIK